MRDRTKLDPISLVLGAILAGAAQGGHEVAGRAVVDTYTKFRDSLRAKLSSKKSAQVAFEEYAEDPENWQPVLESYLRQMGVQKDKELLEAASKVLSATDPKGASDGKYTVEISDSYGVQVGDHNTQTNHY